ncbi:8-amino-7-oxononanoate synthase [uncultured Duncaniella sp.]|uniref:aminotransferase class I/II-fold pyridoxal phosphate-dependent enzyme n=1 Tax=uncultured Duncaniella sp. TaxID=2768039 RepID=UPI0025FB5850|nr:8-amino-7-oxononanoate synthase [uncultured Duncaniella sp.]
MNRYSDILDRLHSEGNFRSIPHELPAGAEVTDLSSNDYLGLGADTGLQQSFFASASNRAIPMTSSASRLLSGRQREYEELENFLGQLYGRPCLLFNSGYHANTGMIQALADSKTLIVADKLVHASIIDGITLSKAPFTRFRHNDLGHLEKIMEKEAANHERVLIVVESVYSMDGDRADIDSIITIKRRYPNAMLYVDEAHAFGVEGPQGLGLCKESAEFGDVDIVVGTFGKACASAGAFCAVSPTLRDYLVNRARSFIFSTSLPPMTVAWTHFMIETFLTMDAERSQLRLLGQRLHDHLQPLSPKTVITPSHIQPLVVGSADRAVELSRRLLEEGFKVLPIRTPTVPPGTERLRISLSAAIPIEEIDRLGHTLAKLLSE